MTQAWIVRSEVLFFIPLYLQQHSSMPPKRNLVGKARYCTSTTKNWNASIASRWDVI